MQEVTTSVKTGSATRCLGVYVDGSDEPVLVPLLTELPRARYRELVRAFAAVADGANDTAADDLVDGFFKEYLPEGVVDAMNQREFLAMVKAWTDASQEDAGATLGE
jgi:hypothetical protein